MAISLKKPENHIREYTPIHICDEIYPNLKPLEQTIQPVNNISKTEIANYLLNTLVKAAKISQSNISDFFTKSCKDYRNATVENDMVIYQKKDNPISKRYEAIQSDFLNSLQSLFLYLETDTATFDGLCEVLDTQWTANRDSRFYTELCKFLADVKTENISAIKDVLSRNKDDISYRGIIWASGPYDNKAKCADIFLAIMSTRLFDDIFTLLRRETKITVHPLFLFVCKNFSATYESLSGDTEDTEDTSDRYIDYDNMTDTRSSLCMYGDTSSNIPCKWKQNPPRFLDWMYWHSDNISIANTGVFVASVVTGIPLFAATNGSLPSVILCACGALSFANFFVEYISGFAFEKCKTNRDMILLYGGLQAFLADYKLHYTISFETKKLPRKIRKIAIFDSLQALETKS